MLTFGQEAGKWNCQHTELTPEARTVSTAGKADKHLPPSASQTRAAGPPSPALATAFICSCHTNTNKVGEAQPQGPQERTAGGGDGRGAGHSGDNRAQVPISREGPLHSQTALSIWDQGHVTTHAGH